MGKTFILGATGHLGGLVVDYLLDRGLQADHLVAVVRDTNKASTLEQRGLEIRWGDYDQPDFSPEVFKDADKLLFISSPSFDNTHRIKQHATVVEAARDAGVPHIIYTGLAFPERHHSGLENVHISTELAIKSSGIPYTFLRNTFYMDIFLVKTEIERAIRNGKLVTAVNGQKLNMVARRDLALAAAVVLSTEGHEDQTYELTYPEPYSYEDIAAIISKISGKTVIHEDVSAEQLREYLMQSGVTPDQMMLDSSAFQPVLADGWASQTSDALVNLIGPENITTVESAIKKLM